MQDKALILVDLENEWIDEDSEYFIWEVSQLITNTNNLIEYCRNKDYKIIFIQHIEKDSDSEFAEDSQNIEIFTDIDKQPQDIIISKNKISAFYQTTLEKELEGISDIVVGWILTNLCVRSLVQDAYDRDYNITLIQDCCQAFDQATHDFTLKDIKATRDEIKIIKVDNFI